MSETTTITGPANIATRLTEQARARPHALAIAAPSGRDRSGRMRYVRMTYRQLDLDSDAIARGLNAIGIIAGTRAVVMVRPGPDFFSLVFAVFKACVVPVLIDPGIGPRNLGRCCAEAAPEAFIGIPKAVWAGRLLGWGRGTVRRTVVVAPGRRSRPGARTITLDDVRTIGRREIARERGPQENARELGPLALPTAGPLGPDGPAAVLFTSGSTGAPKGAVYTHRILNAQADLVREIFEIEPGEVDLCTFPLFALFAPVLGMTAVVPDMDPTRPARANPAKLIEAIEDFGATNLFGSPALLRQLTRGEGGGGALAPLPDLRRVVSAGAPVPLTVLEAMAARLAPPAQVRTTYGATEALPVATIGTSEILAETRSQTEAGRGVCVGRPAPGLDVRVIAISDGPIEAWSDDLMLPDGEIGEIVVAGTVVTREYFNRPEATRLAKIPRQGQAPGGPEFFHRMGDVGHRDGAGRIWFCGRKSHRVVLPTTTLFTVPCEAIFNAHPLVFRSALVGVPARRPERPAKGGSDNGAKNGGAGPIVPVICVETVRRLTAREREALRDELLERAASFPHTQLIQTILFHRAFPVDIRHNSKIFREKLASWAVGRTS